MASIEGRVLSRAITDRDLQPLMEAHVGPEWFADEEHARIFTFMREHHARYGEVPSRQVVRDNFPAYTVRQVEDSLPVLVDRLRDKRKFGLTVAMLQDANTLVEEDRDHASALARLTTGIAEIEAEVATTTDIDFVTTWEDRLDYYESLKDSGGMLGLPVGFPTMDEATAGLQAEQLVCIVATPKAGKSTLAMVMALHICEQGHLPLFISFEMSAMEQAARFDAFRAGINHKKLTTGMLNKEEWRALERAGKEAERRGHSFVALEDIAASTTVSGIDAAIERHNPSVVFIDGVYLMHDELGEDPGSPQALTNITRNLKRLAQRRKLPIVMSTQALPSKVKRRTGVTADSIGYSSSFFQDSDVLFGLQEEESDDLRKLRIINARNTGKREVTLEWDWETSTFKEREAYASTVGAASYEDEEDD